MDKYQRVQKTRPMVNEIHIASQGIPRNYITYAMNLLGERGGSKVVLKAMGNAIPKAVTVAEDIKRRIPDLHQNTTIGSAPITYALKTLEDGVSPLETVRQVPMIKITLSTAQLDTTSEGYQPPLPAEQVKPLEGKDSRLVRNPASSGRVRNPPSQYQNGNRGGGSLPSQVQVYNKSSYPQQQNKMAANSENAQYDNGRLIDKGSGVNERGNYGEKEIKAGHGGDESSVGVKDEDGWQVVCRRRRRRGRGRGGWN